MAKTKTKNTKLKRALGFKLLTFYGLGNIVGAGIYVLIGKVVGEAGSDAPLSFILASVVAGLTAFSYAELSSRYPVAAGASTYVSKAFNLKIIPILMGVGLILAGSTSSATLINGMVGYLGEIIKLNPTILSLGVIVLLGTILFGGIKESAVIASILTFIEVGGLALIIILGYSHSGFSNNLQAFNPSGWSLSLSVLPMVVSGTFLAIYAYFGFEDMVDVAEEVKNPRRNIPLSLILALIVATIFYLLILGVAMGNASPDQLISSDAPLKTVFSSVTSLNPAIIVVAGAIAAGNGMIVNAVMGSRIFYGLSERGMMPKAFLKLSTKRVPIYGTVFVLLLITGLALFVNLVSLAKATSMIVLTIFVLVNLSLIKLKLSKNVNSSLDYFKVNIAIPILGFISSGGLLISEIFKYAEAWV